MSVPEQEVAERSLATMWADDAASKALGMTVVEVGPGRAVVASYPEDVADHFRNFLLQGDIEVTAMGSHDIYTAAEVGTLGRDQVVAMVSGAERTGAEAVLVPDTAMHSLAWLPDLESVAAMKAAADQRDETGVSTHDIAFHRDLVRCAESPRLTRMHETLMAETRMCIHALTPTYAVGGLRVAEHRRIARSFTKRDPELTDQLLIHHMDDALVRLGAMSGSDSTDELTS